MTRSSGPRLALARIVPELRSLRSEFPVSESGRLCRGDGNQERGNRRGRVLVLAILLRREQVIPHVGGEVVERAGGGGPPPSEQPLPPQRLHDNPAEDEHGDNEQRLGHEHEGAEVVPVDADEEPQTQHEPEGGQRDRRLHRLHCLASFGV